MDDSSLSEKNEDRINQLFVLFEKLNDRPDHTAEVELLNQRITMLEAKIEELRDMVHDETKEGKIESIIEAARNKADAGMEAVVMTYKEIKLASGVSTSQAYRYIDELPDSRKEFREREDEDKTRGLIVDVSHGETE
jgi:lipid II:glycine glycyltransferase (peptidoglycan interpeptide bridge formation enzyme)